MDEHGPRDDAPLELTCPCCSTKLTVDVASGEVLHEERPAKPGRSWDDALSAGQRQQAEAEKAFDRGLERQRSADDILEKKFREALEKADKTDDPPPRIFDLD